MTSSIFPDVNVWLALTLTRHQHHETAWKWYVSLEPGAEIVFCRVTQIGLLRLLTTQSVVGIATFDQRGAWKIYDQWLLEGGCVFREEPKSLEHEFRLYANRDAPFPREWADSYLAAFAAAASLELATFDRALSRRVRRSVCLV